MLQNWLPQSSLSSPAVGNWKSQRMDIAMAQTLEPI